MQCAPNELRALLGRAIEARQGNVLDFDAMARNVVELEFLGFPGVEFLLDALQLDWGSGSYAGLRLHCENGLWTAPAEGASLLLHASGLIDQALWLANQHGAVQLGFSGASHAPALAAEFVHAHQASWAMELRWPDPDNGSQWLMKLGASRAELGLWLAEAGDDSNGDILITLAQADHFSAVLVPGDFRMLRGPEEFEASRKATLAGGLTIAESAWDDLIRIGDGVLVESSKASRQGAGE